MSHLSLDDIARVLLTLDAHSGSIPKTADALKVSHPTLWRYLRKHAEDRVPKRRERVCVDALPLDVCIAIFRDNTVLKLDTTTLMAKYAFSRQAIHAAIRRGRHATERSAGRGARRPA